MSLIKRAAAIVLMLFSLPVMAEYRLNLHEGVTSFSKGAFEIHTTVMWICVGIGIVVFGAMFYAIIFHRRSKHPDAATFHESTKLEILWTIIPILILITMAIPATRVLIAEEDTSNSDMSIKVTGYQWKWHYDYLQDGISFFSSLATPEDQIKNKAKKDKNYLLEVDHPLVIPANKKVRFLFTGNDVIHSWWVPDFGFKQDAIPGYINDAWVKVAKPGIYRGQCAELCGQGHGFMPIVVEVKSQADYDAWVNEKKAAMAAAAASSNKTWTMDELMSHGKEVFTANCATCHQANGEGIPNVFPALKGSPVATGPVAVHISTVLHGRTGTAMQAFGPQLNDADLAAVITYERNAWGNNTGDAVQPSDIKSAR